MDILFIVNLSLWFKPQSPQATVCYYVGAAALVLFRPGRTGLPDRVFSKNLTKKNPLNLSQGKILTVLDMNS